MTRAWKAAAAALLLVTSTMALADEKPDATIEFSGRSVAVGVGVSWGQGTLHYQGKDYPFSLNGLSVLNIGANEIQATGEVYHLASLEAFSGNYSAVSAGATAGKEGEASAAMENLSGVVIRMRSTTKGLQLNASVEGVAIKLTGAQN